jgi:magnesium transporter
MGLSGGRRKEGKRMQPDVEQLLDKQDWATLRQRLAEMAPAEIAEALLELDKLDRVVLFRSLPRQISDEVFSFLDPEHQRSLIVELTDEETRTLLANQPPDDRTQLFEELPGALTQKLLNMLPPEELFQARQLLGYPEESVGRLMTPDYVAVRPDWTIARALDHIRAKGKDSETINVIYVVDSGWHLLDELRLSRFILASPDQLVHDIMDGVYVSLSAFDDREMAVQVMRRHDLYVLPVVNTDGVLVGIVTNDDVLELAEEEATEDFQRIGGMAPVEIDYRHAGVALLWRKRIGWLMLLLVADFMSSSVIAFYEASIEAVVALAFFIPMLIDSGGNTGTQSATLIIRALATGQLALKDWPRIAWKELRVGLLLGTALAAVVYARSFFWRGGPQVGLVVAITMVCLVLWANLIGAILPVVLSKLRLDPAVVSSPFITTAADVAGLLIYFNVARLVLGL